MHPNNDEWVLLHAGALGDLILTLHLLERLAANRPPRRFVLVSRVDPGRVVVAGQPAEWRSMESHDVHSLFAAGDDDLPHGIRALFEMRFVISAVAAGSSPLHRNLLRCGPKELFSFDPVPVTESERHVTEQWRTRLESQGLLFPKCVYHNRASGETKRWAGATTRRTVVIHPGSGGRKKCWPLASFVDVARLLRSSGCEIRFLLGPVEAETWPREQLKSLQSEFVVQIAETIGDLHASLDSADLFVGNDSGPTHLAAFRGKSTVALFGPTNPSIWRPLGPRVRVLSGDGAKHDDWGLSAQAVGAVCLGEEPCAVD